MLFNSLQFVFFFVIITILYWYSAHKRRWLLLLIASCYFYMAFVPVYLFILFFTIIIDYFAGIYLEKVRRPKLKKVLLAVSLVANIGVLAIFKYYNFFNQILEDILSYSSHHSPFPILEILLPIGLSFHTFQAMSYTIEVYRGNHKAEKHFGIYALYVMFYPQLVAGPIERPQNILWQFHKPMTFDFESLKSGLMQMAFGLFKKVVIADRLALVVDGVYSNPEAQNGKTVLIAIVLYSFQIYCDFSGYSDIGIGAARTMGFTLLKNFDRPYEAHSISGFWSKWHISLSTWFRDYLYIPLGGNRVKLPKMYYNIMIVFLISGLWHGAQWTFIIWGALHGCFLILENFKNLMGKRIFFVDKKNALHRVFQTLVTFTLVTLAWIFFRSPNFNVAIIFLRKLLHLSFHDALFFKNVTGATIIFSFLLIVFLLVKEKLYLMIPTKNTAFFYALFISILVCCYLFGIFNNNQFIYFQF